MDNVEQVASAHDLHNYVMGNLARMGGSGDRGFIERIMDELRHQLIEAGIHGLELRLVRLKIEEDLSSAYTVKRDTLGGLSAREVYMAIEPPYMGQLLDEDTNHDLIEVWFQRMIDGTMTIPEKYPATLASALAKKKSKLVECLDPSLATFNMIANRQLFARILDELNLI